MLMVHQGAGLVVDAQALAVKAPAELEIFESAEAGVEEAVL